MKRRKKKARSMYLRFVKKYGVKLGAKEYRKEKSYRKKRRKNRFKTGGGSSRARLKRTRRMYKLVKRERRMARLRQIKQAVRYGREWKKGYRGRVPGEISRAWKVSQKKRKNSMFTVPKEERDRLYPWIMFRSSGVAKGEFGQDTPCWVVASRGATKEELSRDEKYYKRKYSGAKFLKLKINPTLKKGYGYWDVTSYPYGGKFARAGEDTPVEIIERGVGKFPKREVKVRFADGRVGIVDLSAMIENNPLWRDRRSGMFWSDKSRWKAPRRAELEREKGGWSNNPYYITDRAGNVISEKSFKKSKGAYDYLERWGAGLAPSVIPKVRFDPNENLKRGDYATAWKRNPWDIYPPNSSERLGRYDTYQEADREAHRMMEGTIHPWMTITNTKPPFDYRYVYSTKKRRIGPSGYLGVY